MIIIEGPDLVGKTTLCQKLLKHPRLEAQGYIYAHFTRLPKAFDYYRGYVDRASRRIVQDRFHLSEVAYSLARGDEPMVCYETYRLIDGYLRQLGALTVLITADEHVIRSRWGREEMYNLDTVIKVNDMFHQLWSEHKHDIDMHFSLSMNHPFITDEQIELIVKEYDRRQDHLSTFLT